MPAVFSLPDVVDNTDGWGPTNEPEELKGIPYAPFLKSEKVGRIADFAQTGYNKYGGTSLSACIQQLANCPFIRYKGSCCYREPVSSGPGCHQFLCRGGRALL